MSHTPSRRLMNMARIILMMFAFALLSPSVQACALAQSQIVMPSMTADNPCSVSGENSKLNVPCTAGIQNHAEDCTVQSQKTVSTARISSVPVALQVALEQPALAPKSNNSFITALSSPFPPTSPVPLSILHCSFQI